jgi:pimeloyl-[acyl-carrier protein] synthase
MLDAITPVLTMSDIGGVLAKLDELAGRLSAAERAVLEDLLRTAGVGPADPVQYNPFLPGVHGDPYAHYHRLLRENPVHWSDALKSWVVCRHDDVAVALRDSRLSSRTGDGVIAANVPPAMSNTVERVGAFAVSLLNELDPPQHTRMRRLLTRALATAGERAPVDVDGIAHRLLDAVEPAGRMDVVADFAHPLPAAVAAELIGVPAADRPGFGRLVHDVVRTFSDGFCSTPAMTRGEEALAALTDRLTHLLALRRARPGTDLLSALIGVPDASDAERMLMAANVVLGTQENVTHAISLMTRTIIREPSLPERLAAAPELLPAAVEEALRYEGTAPIISRIASADTEIGGARIPAGQPVTLLLAAANRDPARFDRPDDFDPHRFDPHRFEAHRGGRHISFGLGRHACPGSALARAMILAAMKALLNRFTSIEPADAEPAWRQEINVHGLTHLPVTFRSRRRSGTAPGVRAGRDAEGGVR